MPFSKIICALDLTEHSKTVAAHAAMIAKLSNASIIAVYAAPTMKQYTGFHVPPNMIDDFVGEIVSGANKAMEDFLLDNLQGCNVSFEIIVGNPAEEILALSEKENADLIIMGTHGRKGFDRILFGSVAEFVVKNANIPVMTIKPQPEE